MMRVIPRPFALQISFEKDRCACRPRDEADGLAAPGYVRARGKNGEYGFVFRRTDCLTKIAPGMAGFLCADRCGWDRKDFGSRGAFLTASARRKTNEANAAQKKDRNRLRAWKAPKQSGRGCQPKHLANSAALRFHLRRSPSCLA